MYLNQLDKNTAELLFSSIKVLSIAENYKKINIATDCVIMHEADYDNVYDENQDMSIIKQRICRIKKANTGDFRRYKHFGPYAYSLTDQQLLALTFLMDSVLINNYDYNSENHQDDAFEATNFVNECFGEVLESIILDFKDNANIKQQIKQIILEGNYDPFELDEEKKYILAFEIDSLKEQGATLLVERFLEMLEGESELNEKGGKIILFNLLRAFPDVIEFNPLARRFLERLCDLFGVEYDYIEELHQLATQYYRIEEELNEIVYE